MCVVVLLFLFVCVCREYVYVCVCVCVDLYLFSINDLFYLYFVFEVVQFEGLFWISILLSFNETFMARPALLHFL